MKKIILVLMFSVFGMGCEDSEVLNEIGNLTFFDANPASENVSFTVNKDQAIRSGEFGETHFSFGFEDNRRLTVDLDSNHQIKSVRYNSGVTGGCALGPLFTFECKAPNCEGVIYDGQSFLFDGLLLKGEDNERISVSGTIYVEVIPEAIVDTYSTSLTLQDKAKLCLTK